MSLINKMLQDLDARGSQAGQGMPLDIKSVARDERRASLPLIGGVVALVAVLAVAGVFGWRYYKQPAPVAKAPTSVALVKAPAAPVAQPVTAAAPAPVAPAPAVEAKPVAAEVKPAPDIKPVVKRPNKTKVTLTRAEQRKLEAAKAKAKVRTKPAAVRAAAKPAVKPAPVAEGRVSTPAQGAEGAYRRALAALAEGRVTEATSGLEQALQIEPRHEAARQTLVGLLIEARRKDEAARLLQAGLALDARQPSMAMLLARLQIESGGPAIETLMRTLPHAAGNGDYHAFLAGALQRENRHREASEQYQAALRLAPQNGVWWMGLGISLQADKRNADAVAAFERARDAGNLTPQLQGFVERRLQLLGK